MKCTPIKFDERLELFTVLFYMTDYKEALSFDVNLQEEYSFYKKIRAVFENIDISAITKPFQKLLEAENFGFEIDKEISYDS